MNYYQITSTIAKNDEKAKRFPKTKQKFKKYRGRSGMWKSTRNRRNHLSKKIKMDKISDMIYINIDLANRFKPSLEK